ncbi:MAG: ABC transporter permease subunit [Myxococcota bacterium]
MAQRESLVLRPAVVLSIAWRDLSALFRGRRGWVLPVIAAILLGPLAAAPFPQGPDGPPGRFAVSGDVPDAVRVLDTVGVVPSGGIVFEQTDTILVVHGAGVPDVVRDALDAQQPAWSLTDVPAAPWPLPGRTLILALLAASILTGAVSESLPGERSRGTLEALLTAAVSRAEVVLGKWLAWASFGAVAATAASLLAIVTGRVELGWWLLAIPTVPMGSVALGLFMVRRSRDVVGGATVSLRVLPAVLSILGIMAWFLGLSGSHWGALVPFGGALVAAGNTWPGALPAVLSAAVTLSITAALLIATTRDLERSQKALVAPRLGSELMSITWALGGWWVALGTAAVWVAAGNASVGTGLPTWPALLAGTLALTAVMVVRSAHETEPGKFLGLARPRAHAAWLAPLVALMLAGVLWLGPVLPLPHTAVLDLLVERQTMGLAPLGTAPLVGLVAVLVQELVFRGWIQRTLGPVGSTLAFVAVITPLDPVGGLVVGGSLAALTHVSNSAWPAVAARVLGSAIVAAVSLGA